MAQPYEIRLDNADPAPGASIVTRHDTYRLDKTERLADGSLRVDALVTRSGVFTYHDSSGQEIQEYRPPSEVQDAASVASLKDKTVTVLHPPGLVTPGNWKEHAVGHVTGAPAAREDGVMAQLIIKDASAIADIQSGKLKEISCGYQLRVDNESGVSPDGKPYTKVQRGIKHNHVAIGPEGWGRQGAQTSLRLDSAGNQIVDRGDSKMNEILIHFDGQTYTVKVGSPEHTNLLARIAAKDTADKAKLDAATALATTEKARADAAETASKKEKERADAAPELARARVAVETLAVKVLGEGFKLDGADGKPLSNTALRIAVIQKFEPEFKADGKDDVYIQAYCDSVSKRGSATMAEDILLDHSGVNTTGTQIRTDSSWYNDSGEVKLDDSDTNYYDAMHAKAQRDREKMHKRPLSITKDRVQV